MNRKQHTHGKSGMAVFVRMIIFLLPINLFYSCENKVDYPFPDAENKIILNGLFTNTESFNIKLSNSYPAYDKDPLRYVFIEDAEVNIYQNNEIVTTLSHGYEGSFHSDFIPKTNTQYQIRVVCGKDTITSGSSIPIPVKITIDSVYPIVKDGKDYLIADLLIDDPDSENFYYFTSSTSPSYFKTKLSSYETYDYWINDDKIGVWPSDNENTPEIFTFSDENFNGTQFSFNMQATPLQTSFEDVTLYVALYSITRDFYMYLKTLNNQIHASSSNLSDLPAVHNNIINGFGIFSGYSCITDSVFFKGNPDEKELSYGIAFYKDLTFDLNDARLFTNSFSKNFSLSVGAVSVFIDDSTNTLVSNGINVIADMTSKNMGYVNLGKYQHNNNDEKEMIITKGATFISDYSSSLISDSLSVSDGEIEIIELSINEYGSNTDKQIIKLNFNLVLSDNEHVTGFYEGPVIVIRN